VARAEASRKRNGWGYACFASWSSGPPSVGNCSVQLLGLVGATSGLFGLLGVKDPFGPNWLLVHGSFLVFFLFGVVGGGRAGGVGAARGRARPASDDDGRRLGVQQDRR